MYNADVPGEWMVASGHLSAAAVLVVDTVYEGSNGSSEPSWSAGTKHIVGGLPSLRLNGAAFTVRAATTANITISTALNNGDSLDGVTLATGDLVLVKDQSTASQNGIYIVGSTPVRALSFCLYDQHPGTIILVLEGTVNSAKMWKCTSLFGGTLNTTSISYTRADVPNLNPQVFDSTGTYTPTSGMRYCIVEALGAGGGGGGAGSNNVAGGGGGAGGYSQAIFTAADIGSSVTVTIGAGGSGGAAGNNVGSSGGSTTFGALITCTGGAGGVAGSGAFGYAAGGTGSGGDLNIAGGNGASRVTGADISINPPGGMSYKYSTLHGLYCATPAAGAVSGQDGIGYGSGGSGGIRATTSTSGGDGADGLVVITEFF